jgi:hypothetical protein
VGDLLCFKKRASERGTEEDGNLRNTNTAALSEGVDVHEKGGVKKQVIMCIFHQLQNTQLRFRACVYSSDRSYYLSGSGVC